MPARQGDAAVVHEIAQAFLDAGCELSVCHLEDPGQLDVDYESMRRLVADLTVLPQRPETYRQTLSLDPDDWCPDEFSELALDVAREFLPDVVVVQTPMLAKCLRLLKANSLAPVTAMSVIDIYEGRREKWERQGISHPWFSTTRELEDKAWSSADVLLVLQSRELEQIQKRCRSVDAWHVPHLPTRAWHEPADAKTILYIGADNDENKIGLTRFVDECFVAIKEQHPDAKFIAAGRAAEVLSNRSLPNDVSILGVIDPQDLPQFYAKGTIAVNPTPIGTGQAIKTIEGLANGRCVVAFPTGIGGLALDTPGLSVASDYPEMGKMVMRLLDDADELPTLNRQVFEASTARYKSEPSAALAVERLCARARALVEEAT